jgi:hypothetical protein
MEEGVDPKFLETQRRLQEEARERNRSEFGEEGEAARLRLEGFRAGLYVRLVLKSVPVEFIKVRLSFQKRLFLCIHKCCSSYRHQPHFTILYFTSPLSSNKGVSSSSRHELSRLRLSYATSCLPVCLSNCWSVLPLI